MDRISTLIVDDERPARRRLLDLLEGRPEVAVVGECAGGAEAVRLIREGRPELLFLDIQMPALDGFDVIARVGPAILPVTVFVTAHDAYAVRAFEACALDYLLKPYSDERFVQCLTRAVEYVRTHRREEMSGRVLALLEQGRRGPEGPAAGDAPPGASPYLEHVLVKVGRRVVLLPVAEIDWVEAAGVYVELHARGRSYLHRASLASLEARLDPRRFARIHRSAIVNVHGVKELHPHSHGDYITVLKCGARLRLSRSYRAAFETCLRQTL